MTRLRISAMRYQDDEATGDLDLLGEVALEGGKLALYPEQGKRAQLQRFLDSYRNYGVGPTQSDAEFLDALPDRVGFYQGKAEAV